MIHLKWFKNTKVKEKDELVSKVESNQEIKHKFKKGKYVWSALDIISHVWNGMPVKTKVKKTITARTQMIMVQIHIWVVTHFTGPTFPALRFFLVQFWLDKDSRLRCPKIHKWEILQKETWSDTKTTQTNNTKTHQTPTQPRHEIGSHKPFFAMLMGGPNQCPSLQNAWLGGLVHPGLEGPCFWSSFAGKEFKVKQS